jgi:hypothetical protein
MNILFEVIDKTGRKIRLTKERWTHITSPENLHPYMSNYLDKVEETLKKPQFFIQHENRETVEYYLFLKERKQYLLVGVKYLNGAGFVTTAFITRHIRRK